MGKFDFLNFDSEFNAEEFLMKQKSYAHLKRDELDSLPEDEIVPAVTAWIESKFSEDWSDMCEKINSLPTPCMNVYCADYVKSEVLNGGFSQAFFNTSRDFIGAAAEGFRAIGCIETADAVELALKAHFDSGVKPTGRSIDDFINFRSNGAFDDADRAFFEAFDQSKFDNLAGKYILSYKKYFGD
ncbi:MAG: DMP19 family protein [Oscillospiraceae bacterium]|nr:DMP19 family protein [Oscillospiraceae bacterium]